MEEDLKSFRIRVPRLLSDSPFLADILSNHYGIRSATISLLTGYDDLNFLLVDCKYANSSEKKEAAITQQQQQTGMFTLKFSNRWEARFYPQLCDAQNQLTSLLAQNGLNCPKLVTQVDETAHRLVQLPGTGATDHLQPTPVRLFTFIPGQTLAEWLAAEGGRRFTAPSAVPQLATEVGRLLGRFHAIIDQAQFCPPVFHEYSPLISLECWPQLRQEFTCQRRQISNLMDGQRAKMCEMVFEELERQVLDQRQKFLQGLIHSDFNEANILLLPESEKPEICGLLDFGDCHRSFRLADLANAILYLYLHFREHFLLDADGHLLRLMAKSIWIGYCSETICPIPAFDLAHLLLFMQARLVSSLVYGLRTSRLEMEADSGQSMDYVLQTQQRGWTVLEELITNIEHRMDCLKFD